MATTPIVRVSSSSATTTRRPTWCRAMRRAATVSGSSRRIVSAGVVMRCLTRSVCQLAHR